MIRFSSVGLSICFAAGLTVCGVVAGSALAGSYQLDASLLTAETITVLPAIDLRNVPTQKVNLKSMREHALNALRRRNYTIAKSDDPGGVGKIIESDLRAASPAWAKQLGPMHARLVMIIGLNDVQGTFLTTAGGLTDGSATASGFLFDKQTGVLLWQGTGLGEVPPTVQTSYAASALSNILTRGISRDAAIANAVGNLVAGPAGLPALPKKHK